MSDSTQKAVLAEIHALTGAVRAATATVDRLAADFRILFEKNQDPGADPDALLEGIEKLIGEIQVLPEHIETLSSRMAGIDARLHDLINEMEASLQDDTVTADGAGRIMGNADPVFSTYKQLNRHFDELMERITALMSEIAEM